MFESFEDAHQDQLPKHKWPCILFLLNLMPIPHVFEMNKIIPTSRTTDNSGRRVLTSVPDVHDSQARSNNISHG